VIIHGDCIEVMAGMDPESVDAIVTDPPYELSFMNKSWDQDANHGAWTRAAYRVAKPSAYLLAFGGTRTVHRMTVALEDAGWIIRDMLVWGYASGFPKSKASLKPAWEPIVMARKPGPLRDLAIDACRIGAEPMPHLPGELGAHGVYGRMARMVGGPAAIMERWDDERNLCASCAADADNPARPGTPGTRASTTPRRAEQPPSDWATSGATDRTGTGSSDGTTAASTSTSSSTARSGRTRTGRSQPDTLFTTSTDSATTTDLRTCRSCGETSTVTITTDGTTYIRSDLQDGTTSGGTELGRWPANLVLTDPIFDGGIEGVVGGGYQESTAAVGAWAPRGAFPIDNPNPTVYGDSGTYSRFFLIPKADRADREPVLGGLPLAGPVHGIDGVSGGLRVSNSKSARANVHPTVKPTDLMRHLVRLVTPTGGTVLDPFLGSGTTGLAAEMEGFPWIGIEREAEYVAIAEARLNGTQRGLGLEAI